MDRQENRFSTIRPRDLHFFFGLGYRQYALILQSLRYFEQSGLFSREEANVNELEFINEKIKSVYDNIAQSLLKRTEGDTQKGDYLFNVPYFRYYYQLDQENIYNKNEEQRFKDLHNNTNNGGTGNVPKQMSRNGKAANG